MIPPVVPPRGICLPCQIQHVRDGDTVVVTCLSNLSWAIRLIDCWAPETSTEEGRAAKHYAETLVETAGPCVLFIPLDRLQEIQEAHDGALNLLQLLTFDRVPGVIYFDDYLTLNELMVKAGHATKAKP